MIASAFPSAMYVGTASAARWDVKATDLFDETAAQLQKLAARCGLAAWDGAPFWHE